jgi:hypothetical protein
MKWAGEGQWNRSRECGGRGEKKEVRNRKILKKRREEKKLGSRRRREQRQRGMLSIHEENMGQMQRKTGWGKKIKELQSRGEVRSKGNEEKNGRGKKKMVEGKNGEAERGMESPNWRGTNYQEKDVFWKYLKLSMENKSVQHVDNRPLIWSKETQQAHTKKH